jgi:DNA invertase Pin-like site-specific DNA recombinase
MVTDAAIGDSDLVEMVVGFIIEMCPELHARQEQLKAEIRTEFSGLITYIPRRSIEQRRRTAEQVLTMFNGRNATEVARKLGVGRATVYRIIKQAGGRK